MKDNAIHTHILFPHLIYANKVGEHCYFNLYFLFLHNPKVIQIRFESVLGNKAGVHQEAFLTIPFFEAAVVEQLQIVLNSEGDDIILQALFEEDQAAYTAIPVLKRMDAFECRMGGDDILKGLKGYFIFKLAS